MRSAWIAEKDLFKCAWLERLAGCGNVAALEDVYLMSEDWQSALAAVLSDLGASSLRQAATTELALGILTGAAGALKSTLNTQIAAVLMKSTEWPASITPDLPGLLNTAERHPACKSALECMINNCLGTVK